MFDRFVQFVKRTGYGGIAFSIPCVALLILGGCSQAEQREDPARQAAQNAAAGSAAAQPPPESRGREPREAPPAPPPPTPAGEQLQAEIESLAESLDGTLGIAVREADSAWVAQVNGSEMFPQQSVSKLWVAIAILDQVDRGQLDLSQEVTLRPGDLTLFYQPIRPLILRDGGYTTTLGDLLERAIARSDNTANDFLLRRVGGPDAVRSVLRSKGLDGIRFGPGEPALQSEIAGLEWKQEYSRGRAFFNAREEVPAERRRGAFEDYLEDPMDGAAPAAIADALARLEQGDLLSPASTDRLLSIMGRTKSGSRRLKGGLRSGWSIAHKTGTGQIFQGAQAGYNDVGLLTSPAGRTYSVAVLIGRTDEPIPTRMRLMQDVTRAVIDYDESRPSRTAGETDR